MKKRVVVLLLAAITLLAGLAAAQGGGWLRWGLGGGDGAEAKWPSAQDALHRLERYDRIHIKDKDGFNPENGVTGGSGRMDDPYIFQGIFAREFVIDDVEAAYVIRDSYVSGTLRLDYTGEGAKVENSTVGFFLTDTNRKHTAPHTWLDVRNNQFGAARIRHASGAFVDNVVGHDGRLDPDRLALEVQGYNGLLFTGNTIRGPSEFRLHGHHFATGFDHVWGHGHHGGDPTERHFEIRVERNEFHDATGQGVRISDRDHAANDRTANSEPDERLNLPHRHFTRFWFTDNLVRGAGVIVEEPHARDERHLDGGETNVTVARNRIEHPLHGIGIDVRKSNANVLIMDNVIEGARNDMPDSAGVRLREIQSGRVELRGGSVRGFEHGAEARNLKQGASWSVEGVSFEEGHGPWWDRSVASAPSMR